MSHACRVLSHVVCRVSCAACLSALTVMRVCCAVWQALPEMRVRCAVWQALAVTCLSLLTGVVEELKECHEALAQVGARLHRGLQF